MSSTCYKIGLEGDTLQRFGIFAEGFVSEETYLAMLADIQSALTDGKDHIPHAWIEGIGCSNCPVSSYREAYPQFSHGEFTPIQLVNEETGLMKLHVFCNGRKAVAEQMAEQLKDLPCSSGAINLGSRTPPSRYPQ